MYLGEFEDLTADEFKKMGAQFTEIAEHPGVKALMRLLAEGRRAIGEIALSDETHPKEWWRGFSYGFAAVEEKMKLLLEVAATAKAEKEAPGKDPWKMDRVLAGGDSHVV